LLGNIYASTVSLRFLVLPNQQQTGYAQGFGAFITNNNLIAYNTEFEGRVAVNGSAE